TSRVVSALSPALEQAEIALSRRKPTESLKAYDFYLRGRMCFLKQTKEGMLEAIDFYGKAIELDPEFARGWAATATCYANLRGNYWSADFARETAEAERCARRALALDKTDAVVLATAGYTLAHPVGYIDEGTALLDLSIEFNPNYLAAWMGRGWTSLMLGEVDAFKYFERALRLNPLHH